MTLSSGTEVHLVGVRKCIAFPDNYQSAIGPVDAPTRKKGKFCIFHAPQRSSLLGWRHTAQLAIVISIATMKDSSLIMKPTLENNREEILEATRLLKDH